MKKTSMFLLPKIGMIIGITLLFIACNKNKYQPKGDYQKAGNYGNANTSHSSVATINNWSSQFNDGTNYFYKSTMNWSTITQEVFDKGIVTAYLDPGDGQWYAMPFSDAGDDYNMSFGFSFEVGKIHYQVSGYDLVGAPPISQFNGVRTRVVVVYPEGKAAHPDLDYSNYAEVAKVFGIQN